MRDPQRASSQSHDPARQALERRGAEHPHAGPLFYSELRQAISGISDRVLNERLLELAELGLVERNVLDTRPVRVQYALTAHGAALRPAINELTLWAEQHLQPDR